MNLKFWQRKKKWKPSPRPATAAEKFVRKLLIGTFLFAATAIGSLPLIGGWEQRTQRRLRGDPHALDLRSAATGGVPNGAPLFSGSAEVTRIITLQEDLLTLGLPLTACGATGALKKEDIDAVNMFRAATGLPTSDFIDSQTEALIAQQAERRRTLQDVFANTATREMNTLQRSPVNPSLPEKLRIRHVQANLHLIGYDIGPCKLNGVMNDNVVAAVKDFQQKHPRLIPTGEVDAKTLGLLSIAAREAMRQAGISTIVRERGIDDLTAIIYGTPMNAETMRAMAAEYIEKKGVPEYVVRGILEAVETAGFDFSYIMDLASIESSFTPWAAAGTSSATGNFQFTDGTWATVFKAYGGKYGYQSLIDKVNRGDSGARDYMINLRKDPKVAALMAIEFSRDNLGTLQRSVGGAIGKTELYLAHFLGSGDAVRFIRAHRADYRQAAAPLFPAAAASNRSVFYDAQGKPRSVGDIYAIFSRKMNGQVLRIISPQRAGKLSDVAPNR